jgi:hypothetical protein
MVGRSPLAPGLNFDVAAPDQGIPAETIDDRSDIACT